MKCFSRLVYSILPIFSFYILSLPEFFSNYIIQAIGCVLVIPYLVRYLHQRYINKWVIILLLTFVAGSLVNLFATKNGIGGTLIIISTISLALYCLDNLHSLKTHVSIIILYTFCFLYYMLFVQFVDPNELYEGLSRNHAGFILILWVSFYCFIKKILYNKVAVVVPLIAFFLSYFLEGRSSLGILCLMVFVLLLSKSHKYGIVFLMFLTFILSSNWDLIQELYVLSSFQQNSLDSARYEIWEQYFSHLDFFSVLLGLDTFSVPLIALYSGNPHNAFLNLHARMGVLAFIAFFFLAAYSTQSYLKNREFLLAFFLIAILLRLFFDSDCFIGTYDFIVYTIILYPIYKKRTYSCFQL